MDYNSKKRKSARAACRTLLGFVLFSLALLDHLAVRRIAAFSITIHCSWHQTEFRFICLCTGSLAVAAAYSYRNFGAKKRKTI